MIERIQTFFRDWYDDAAPVFWFAAFAAFVAGLVVLALVVYG